VLLHYHHCHCHYIIYILNIHNIINIIYFLISESGELIKEASDQYVSKTLYPAEKQGNLQIKHEGSIDSLRLIH